MDPIAAKDMVRRFVEAAQTRGDPAAVDEFLAPDFVDHAPFPGFPPTRDGVRQLFAALRAAFPDLQAEVHDQVAEGDRVVTRKTLRGTHRGAFLGVPPTGRTVALAVIDILRVSGGRIAEHWGVADQLGLLVQLGAISPPGG